MKICTLYCSKVKESLTCVRARAVVRGNQALSRSLGSLCSVLAALLAYRSYYYYYTMLARTSHHYKVHLISSSSVKYLVHIMYSTTSIYTFFSLLYFKFYKRSKLSIFNPNLVQNIYIHTGSHYTVSFLFNLTNCYLLFYKMNSVSLESTSILFFLCLVLFYFLSFDMFFLCYVNFY